MFNNHCMLVISTSKILGECYAKYVQYVRLYAKKILSSIIYNIFSIQLAFFFYSTSNLVATIFTKCMTTRRRAPRRLDFKVRFLYFPTYVKVKKKYVQYIHDYIIVVLNFHDILKSSTAYAIRIFYHGKNKAGGHFARRPFPA